MPSTLFVYGTLEIDEVLREVTGQSYPTIPAVLHGYARYMLRGRLYPGIVAQPGASTPGSLLMGLDEVALRRIDEYEGDGYRRSELVVATARGMRATQGYVIPWRMRHLLTGARWDRDRYARAVVFGVRR